MSDGAMMSTPARVRETAVRASSSSEASLSISNSSWAAREARDASFSMAFCFSLGVLAETTVTLVTSPTAAPSDLGLTAGRTIPQCPCDMYSHRHTSPMISRSGTSLLMARAARCTIPSSAQAPVATSSFFSGSPKRMTAGTPSAWVSRASCTAWSTERLKTPGMERTSLRTPDPGQMNMG